MKENNLLASVALFRELYNSNKYSSVSDVIAEFIKGAVAAEQKWSVNSTELTLLLEKVYDFKIPESVVRTTVKNRMKKVVEIKDGYYNFNSSKLKSDYENLDNNFNSISESHSKILEKLYEFIEIEDSRMVTKEEKERISEDFYKYLIDNGVSEEYSQYISAFVIKNKESDNFTASLNHIREGIILYQGIRFTSDLNDQGSWNTELKIFLSTEHLFNAMGYNGEVFKKIFYDFYNLVVQINQRNRNKYGEKLIELKYFEESEAEVEAFFQTAEMIKRGTLTLDPSKTAMKEILNGCKTPVDVKAKKTKFYLELKQLGITLQDFKTSVYNYPEYIVEDEGIIADLTKQSKEKGKAFDEYEYRRFCQIFTKVNYYRGGESKTKFENIGHIFLTANRFALYIGHHTKVKFKEDDIPFATDIDFITSKFWFKLRKGFSEKDNIPKSFDVVTKAQIILSAQINSTVSRWYNELQTSFKDGKFSKEEALALSYDLREKAYKPEDIEYHIIEESLDFLNAEDYMEDYFREKELKQQQMSDLEKRNVELQEELRRRDDLEKHRVLSEKRQREEDERVLYLKARLVDETKKVRASVFYFIAVSIVTIMPISILVLMKAIKKFDEMINELGSYQWIIWGGLILIQFGELLGRSYLFDKERVKHGRIWFCRYIVPGKSRKAFAEQTEAWISDFELKSSKVA